MFFFSFERKDIAEIAKEKLEGFFISTGVDIGLGSIRVFHDDILRQR